MVQNMRTIHGLYGIVDTTFSPQYSHEELAHLMLLGGCRILQLRMKNVVPAKPVTPAKAGVQNLLKMLDSGFRRNDEYNSRNDEDNSRNDKMDSQIFEAAKKIMAFKKKFDFTFIVNDFVEIAGEVGADGVHVGTSDTPVAEARRLLGPNKIIGRSSHSYDEALLGEKMGADYVALGAIFPTKAKGPDHPIRGTKELAEIKKVIRVPLVAIGGINRNNIDDVLATGVDSVAMITGLTQAQDVVEEVRWYVSKMSHHSGQ